MIPMREDPRRPPPLQLTDSLSPELFDEEVDSDEEVSNYLPSEQIVALFSTSGDTNPALSKISTPSAITNSTDSNYEFAPQYPFNVTSLESEYLNFSEFETHGSVNSRWLYNMQAFTSSPEFTNPLPYIPPVNPAGVHGTMDLNPCFLADNYSTAVQQQSSTCVSSPTDLFLAVTIQLSLPT